MDTTEALFTLARAVHTMAPDDKAVRDLYWHLEAELREQTADPAQTDFRGRLDLMEQHERTLAGRSA